MSRLNPAGKPVVRVMFFAHRNVGHEAVLIDQVGFTAAPAPKLEPARSASFVLDCGAAGHSISPLIYGVAGDDESLWATGATARRWGGNPTSRYNWRLNTWNLANDWFFRNAGDPKSSYEPVPGQESAARRENRASRCPCSAGSQRIRPPIRFPSRSSALSRAPGWDVPDGGNGVGRDGKPIAPGSPHPYERAVDA